MKRMRGMIDGLAFASISTDDFKFDPDRATKILAKEIENFRKIGPDFKLVLVDPFCRLNHDLLPKDLIIAPKGVSSLTNQNCSVIGIGCNKLFKPAGDLTNIHLHKAFGDSEDLYNYTRSVYPGIVAEIGKAYPVELPLSNPLREEEKIQYIIHVLGPNMNPNRLDCLINDYERGDELLASAYRALFQCFLNIATVSSVIESTTKTPLKQELETKNFFSSASSDSTMQTLSMQGHSRTPPKLDEKLDVDDLNQFKPFRVPEYKHPNTSNIPRLPGLSLTVFLNEYSGKAYDPFRWFSVKNLCVIYDAYPKAKYHALIMTSVKIIAQVRDLRTEDFDLVRQMHQLAQAIVKKWNVECLIGYHAVPSLTPLHLHIISTDLSSPRLNSKKHWNSFSHPDLFIPSKKVEADLQKHGRVLLKTESELHKLENLPVCCYHCGFTPDDAVKTAISKLQKHSCI